MKKALLTVFSVILLGLIGITGTFGTMYEKELKVNEPVEETQPVEEMPADKEPAETPSETEAPKTEEQPKTEEETEQVSYVMFVEDEAEATEPGDSEVVEPVVQPEKRVLGDVLTNKLKLTKLKDKLGVNKFKNLCIYVCVGLSFVEGFLVSLFFKKSNKVKKQRKTNIEAVGQAIEGYDVQNRPNLKF